MVTPHGRTVHLTDADGTIRDWLVTEAWSSPATDLDQVLEATGEPWGENGRWVLTQGPDVSPLKERLAQSHPIDTAIALPDIVEGGAVAWRAERQPVTGIWRRIHTKADGLIDWSAFSFTPAYQNALAGTVIEIDQAEWRTIEVHTTGPFVLWLNGEVVLESSTVSYMEPEVHSTRLRLPAMTSALHLATWQVAFRETRHVARVRVTGLPVRIVIPSPGADEHQARWGEQILNRVGCPSWALELPEAGFTAPAGVTLRTQTGGGGWQPVTVDADGRFTVKIPPTPGLHLLRVALADDRCPLVREFQVALLPDNSREVSSGTPEQWHRDVLSHVATTPGIAGALVRHRRAGTRLTLDDATAALLRVETRGDCADFEILALLWAWHRIPTEAWEPGLRDRVATALTSMKYWITQPGLDAMCYFTENHQLVWHVAEYLAGLTFSDQTFTVDGRTGTAHADEAARRAAAWIERKLAGGFSEFDSNAYLAIDSYALATLLEFSPSERLRHAATTLLDKTLLSLATNAWRGVHGAAHGRSYVQTLISARFEETSPLLRLIAGLGTLNAWVLPVTSLALSSRYEIPDVVRALAADEPEQWWASQVYQGRLAFERDLLERPYRSDLRIWRTPDVMLSSVQDYRAGLPGLQEHIWGATLGRECQVFLTHPANADVSGSARPNAWAGHRVLPRVHQYRNTLLGLQRFTPTDPTGHTHLWFPRQQFDDVVVTGDWLLGRRGDGYVAVATPGGWSPRRSGDASHQEWLPGLGGDRWVATVGRRATEGTFSDWGERVTAESVDWNPDGPHGLGIAWQVPGGAHLELGFETPFFIDGVPSPAPADEVHLDNPAIRVAFADWEATAAWAGHELHLALGEARDNARHVAEQGLAG